MRIVLTGATGFLGCYILSELLRDPSVTEILCPVRDLGKLPRVLQQYNLPPIDSRVLLMHADVSQPNWGLCISDQTRCRQATHCIHGAAQLHALSLSQVSPTNIGSLSFLTQLLDNGVKTLFISSLIVFAGTTWSGTHCLESDSLNDDRQGLGGYAQSKLFAERALRNPSLSRRRLKIVRPGYLTGATAYPQFPANDLWSNFVLGCKKVGCVPQNIVHQTMDMSPVNWVAQGVIRILHSSWLLPLQTFHLANSTAISNEQVIASLGLPLCSSFTTEISKLPNFQRILLQQAFLGTTKLSKYYPLHLFISTNLDYDMVNSYAIGVTPTAISGELLKLYIQLVSENNSNKYI